jgi:putative phosphoesterase
MKIAFISDIHGNAIALEQVLEDINKKSVDKIIVMGDICYRGPDPKKSIDLIRSLNTEVIKGNADEWVVRGVREGEVPDKVIDMMNREREWTVSRLTPSDIDYLNNLPSEINFKANDISFNLFHATPTSLFDIVPPNADDETIKTKLMSSSESQIYIYAHIHKPYIRYVNGKVIMNTGSVGLPFDGLAMSSYVTVELEEGNIKTSIERVKYDIEKVTEQYIHSEYPNSEMMLKVLRNASIQF